MTHPTPMLHRLQPLLASGVIAVVRLPEAAAGGLRGIARALAAGGVGAVEVTLTTPGAVDAIGDLAADEALAGCIIGAGTVLDPSAARYVIDAGARFVVSPVLHRAVLDTCRERDVPCVPGAFTPTEILDACRAGAALVKLFPAAALGPGYVSDVLAPLPFLRLVPSGGVSLENAGDWIRAGAAAVSVGSALVSRDMVGPDRAADLTARARAFVARVKEARA